MERWAESTGDEGQAVSVRESEQSQSDPHKIPPPSLMSVSVGMCGCVHEQLKRFTLKNAMCLIRSLNGLIHTT